MTALLNKIRLFLPELIPSWPLEWKIPTLPWLGKLTFSIRLKLVLITLTLIALTTLGTSLVIISIMDDVLVQSLFKRGAAISESTATPAGFSILSSDRLALDNLVSKIKESQPDVAYIAIIDHKGTILAHDQLNKNGTPFDFLHGDPLKQEEGYKVMKVTRDGIPCYEFETPIRFADNLLGQVIVGLKLDTLTAAQSAARNKTLWIGLLAMCFGTVGTMLLANFLTAPIKRLADGVSQVKKGGQEVDIKITSRDELGELTGSFNEMSRMILSQKASLEDYAENLEESYTSMVRILAAALDARDTYTLGHSARVAWLSLLIGKKIGLAPDELKELEMACFLHDIGKIRIPDLILTKQGKLDEEELALVKQHPAQGAEILRLAESLHKYIPAVLHHHEWHNGQGYPHGLKGDEIHLHARIVAIADAYDAMTSSRPYRRGLSKSAATREIKDFRGTQFSPHLVDVFIESVNDFDEPEAISFAGELL